MTLITRSVTTGSVGVSIMVPGFDPTKGPLVIAPSTTLDLFTVLTEDQLEAIQPALAQLVAAGDLTVAATVNTASFNPLGNVPVLTASRALASDGSGAIAVSTTTATEIGYVHNVTSAIQTQLNAKQITLSAVQSSASAGSMGATETLTVAGLTAAKTIYAVSPAVDGASHAALVGYANAGTGVLDITWSADPGAGAKVLVTFA